jgi:hypothetical protein
LTKKNLCGCLCIFAERKTAIFFRFATTHEWSVPRPHFGRLRPFLIESAMSKRSLERPTRTENQSWPVAGSGWCEDR